MKSKKPAPAPAAPAAPPMTDSKGNQRVYVDLPRALVTRLNVMAAQRNMQKRVLITSLLMNAIEREAQ